MQRRSDVGMQSASGSVIATGASAAIAAASSGDSIAWRSSYSLIFKARRYCNSRFSYRKLAEIRQAYA